MYFSNLYYTNIFLLTFSSLLFLGLSQVFNLYNITTRFTNFLNSIKKTFILVVYLLSFFLISIFLVHDFNTKFFYLPLLQNQTMHIIDSMSVVMILLCYIIGFVSCTTLGDRLWIYNINASVYLIYFPAIILLFCQAHSILELFLYYELLMLPSVYLVYKLGYTKKSYQANVYFFVWTQLGSLIVFAGVCYINLVHGVTTFDFLRNCIFTEFEKSVLFYLFFFGFGVKTPIWPFHFWLTKVHVEAPSGFSIFLSGFLVKTALYCFYKFSLVLNINSIPVLSLIICLLGIFDASLKMWGQVDIKKLIAYATIQEMNCIYFLLCLGDSWSLHIVTIFLFAHGILSALMFYIIELVYKRTNTRSSYKISGLSELYPNLTVIIWFMILIYMGLPGFLKFFVEVTFIAVLFEFNSILAIGSAIILMFVGGIGFIRQWLNVLYGHPGYPAVRLDLSKEEVIVSSILIFFSVASLPLLFFF